MWQFSSPKIVFGEDALSYLADVQGRRAFIITDGNMVALGFVGRVQEYLAANGIECGVFDEVEPDPSIRTVRRASAALAEFRADVVIGLGGGSCLDASKIAWFLNERPDVDLEEISLFVPYEVGSSQLIAIPTTSGTGADATIGAVLTDQAENRKIVVYARELQPSLTIVDPSFVTRLPRQITADTGMDVLSHAVEGFASPWHNDFSDGLCQKAAQLVFDYLPRVVADGSDLEARERMHNASTMAGLGMTNSSISLGHALAHAMGAVFPSPHGRIVGMLLPYSIEYTAKGGGTRYGELAHFLHLPSAYEAEGAASLVAAMRKLARKIRQPLTIREMRIKRSQFEAALPQLVTKAAEDSQMLTTVRVPDERDLEQLFRHAFDGQSVDF